MQPPLLSLLLLGETLLCAISMQMPVRTIKLQVQRHTALRICRARHGFSLCGRFAIVSSADRYTQSNRLDHMVDSTYTGLSDTSHIGDSNGRQ